MSAIRQFLTLTKITQRRKMPKFLFFERLQSWAVQSLGNESVSCEPNSRQSSCIYQGYL
jgi:hypothetical protein